MRTTPAHAHDAFAHANDLSANANDTLACATTTRREFLTRSAAVATALAAPAVVAQPRTMPARAIPGTNEELPLVGLGSTRPVTAIAERGPAHVEAVIRTLVEHGGRVVDTWPRSDANDGAFGEIISAPELRERLFVTINLEQQDAQEGREHFERTLKLYQRERIDLLNVGSLVGLDAQWPNLLAAKDAGRARYIGVTAAQAALYEPLERFLARERPDFVEINYSVVERDAERLLPQLSDAGIAVLISRPFMNGAYFERLANVPLPEWVAEFECTSWAQFSLKYIFGHPAVTCVLTETTRAENMAENALAAYGAVPNRRARGQMRAFIDAI
jgi:diketogulonate reductase-like aldo/keto reductase